MCGIFTILNADDYSYLTSDYLFAQFNKGKGRGPDHSVLTNATIKAKFGFHRLSINGLDANSNQPLIIEDVALICNGEIYNFKELFQMMNVIPETGSDCEVILHLYIKYGIEQTLQMLDGVFSFVLIDYRLFNETAKMYVVRDPYGVRPMYVMKPEKSLPIKDLFPLYAFASEAKMLTDMCLMSNREVVKKKNARMRHRLQNDILSRFDEQDRGMPYIVEHVQPGTYSVYEMTYKVSSFWEQKIEYCQYHSTGFSSIMRPTPSMNDVFRNISAHLRRAVHKRCSTTERPIACLLSGGLDSSLITALVNEYHVVNDMPQLETYSIGLAGSQDLAHARTVAEYLGTKHNEVVLTEQDFLDAIPMVIRSIESYDTTTVRASIGNWLLGKYISEHSEAKVIFNGDGSDELCGGYLYMHKVPDCIEFDRECRRLLKNIHAFDVLRSDKCISCHGLEPRTPFLDRDWVQFYLSIPMELRNHREGKHIEKFLLRKAFSEDFYLNCFGKPLLPTEVLWRRKEAFSDGVSVGSRSLFTIIQEFTDEQFMENEYKEYDLAKHSTSIIESISLLTDSIRLSGSHLIPQTTEQFHYRKIFEMYYPGMGKWVPYFWMPKYVEAKDASARTLDIYSNYIIE